MDTDMRRTEVEQLRMRCIEVACSTVKRSGGDAELSDNVIVMADEFMDFVRDGLENV